MPFLPTTRAAAALAAGMLLLLPGAARADVAGRVLSDSDHPVAGARVAWLGDAGGDDGAPVAESVTDAAGRFTLAGVEPPGVIAVGHPFFEPRRLPVTGDPAALVVRMRPRPELFEEVEVAGRRGGDRRAPVGVSSAVVRPEDTVAPPSSLAEMVVRVPGVSENGQGGLFQVVSIRGVSRQRVQSRLAGMRLSSERRAGVSASFLDPLLVESVDVLRGPVSSYYGSGALGGVLQVFPRRFTSTVLSAGWESQGHENVLVAGGGNERWSAGIARRDAGDAEDGNGDTLPSAFTRTSAVVRGAWGDGPRLWTLTWVGSVTDDIGKPNSDYPGRTTVYPRETHNLLGFSVEGEAGWSAEAAVHPHDLETDVLEAGVSRTVVENDSVDLSGRFERRLGAARAERRAAPSGETGASGPGESEPAGAGASGRDGGLWARVGVDLFARRDVDADETRRSLDPDDPAPPESFASLDDGRATEIGAFGTVGGGRGRVVWEAGGRFTWLDQDNAGRPASDDTGASGFAGVAVALTGHLTLEAGLGSGLRFPSLTERFFTGTTGRGRVTGNAGLDPERSLNTDVGLRWLTESWLISASVFRNAIDDYIERVEIAPGELTFVNLTDGVLEGIELQGAWHPSKRWRIGFGGHRIDGEADDGGDLADVPPAEIYAGLRWRRDRWTVAGRWTWRDGKDDPGSGERSIGSARLVDASVTLDVNPAWRVAVTASNLLDDDYLPSADALAVPAPGRSLGVRLVWTPARLAGRTASR